MPVEVTGDARKPYRVRGARYVFLRAWGAVPFEPVRQGTPVTARIPTRTPEDEVTHDGR